MFGVHQLWNACLAFALAFSTASCASAERVSDSCPANAKFAAVWSSETHYSQLTFYDESGPIGQKRIEVKGFVPGHEFVKVGQEWIGVSNGNARSDVAHIVRINLNTCEVSKTRVDEVGILNYTADSIGIYVINTLNGVAEVHAHLATGEDIDARFPGEITEVIATSPDAVLLLTSRINEPENLTLRSLDKKTLGTIWESSMPTSSFSTNARIIGDEIYLTEPFTAQEAPSNKLVALNLKTQKFTTTDLLGEMPFVLTSHDSVLYVGNTFLNPTFGPLEDMRTITMIDLKTGKQRVLTGKHGISQLKATKNKLVVYGDYDSETNVAITSYKMPDFEPEYSFKLERPKGKGHMYGAGFLLLDES